MKSTKALGSIGKAGSPLTLKLLSAAVLAAVCSAAPAATVAPYFATWAFGQGGYNTNSLMDAKNKAGLKSATLAFIVAGNSGCTWDDGGNTIDVSMNSDIANFRAAGGKVIVSFGGASGTYLEARCTSSQMSSLIDGLIQRHGIKDLDFDIEGSQASNSSLNTVRNGAIKTLQAKYPDLKVSFTLAVMPEGLPTEQVNLIKGAVAAGVRLDVINIMAMDYGYNGDMGQFAINAANNTATQLQSIYSGKTHAQALQMIGITPMIGHNDDAGIFTVAHANAVASFAKSNGIPLLAYWDLQRDATGPAGDNGSGSNTSNFQYLNAFKAAEGSTPTPTPTPTPTCTYQTWTTGVNYALGTVVKYPANGNFYKEVNAGTNGSDGTDPTISTWYWSPTTCSSPTPTPAPTPTPTPAPTPTPTPAPTPAPTPTPSCVYKTWTTGVNYPLGQIVLYPSNGKYYKEVNAGTNGSDGTDPTISTWYWSPTTCSSPTPAPTPTPTPAPTPTPTPAPTPTPTPAPTPTPTPTCPQFVNGQTYATGAKVTNVSHFYQCTVGGWCSQGGAYEPGVGWAWQDAWNQLTSCN